MAVKFQDYYETLGVARTATAEEIKLAFRKLARIHHPDVAKNKATGEAKFKEINEAYEVLGDPEKRRRYDELGPNWQEGANTAPNPAGGPRGRARARRRA
jgi:curved DNA-binding protein